MDIRARSNATEDPLADPVRGTKSNGIHVAKSRMLGHPVLRAPRNLRMHPALRGFDPIGVTGEDTYSALISDQPVPEPILINKSGTILAGFGRWRLAVAEGWPEVDCVEYPIRDEDSLQFILNHHQPRRGWNAYVRICLALTMKPFLQQRALDNMRAGGKCKGWATLPHPSRMNVRQEIATIAGTGSRNVSNVEQIRERAHPRLIDALCIGTLKINGAVELCKVPKAEQLEKFIRRSEDREIGKVIRKSIRTHRDEKLDPDVVAALEALLQQEARQPGSIEIRVSDSPRTVVVVSRDLLAGTLAQRRLV